MTINPKLIPARLNPDAVLQVPPDSSGFILHGVGQQHYWEGTGLLSIKSFTHGRALYNTGKGLYAVDESSYLILNDEQPYSITIESARPVESFCIFFRQVLQNRFITVLVQSRINCWIIQCHPINYKSAFSIKPTHTMMLSHRLSGLSNRHSLNRKTGRAGSKNKCMS